MTLYDTIRVMESIAARQPAVNMIVENNAYKLNDIADAKYAVFAFVQDQHSVDPNNSFATFRFSLFYIDRLVSDKSNQTEVQSVGIEVLSNILRGLVKADFEVGEVTFQPFAERFTDECAGVYCDVAIGTELSSVCEYDFDLKNVEIL